MAADISVWWKLISPIATFLLLHFVMAPSALAGPPFETDDPFPLPLHNGELYLFAAGTDAVDGTTLDASPGIEANFSFVRNTFLHVIVPLSLNHPKGGRSAYGPGDMEFGFKWRFL